MGLNKKVEEIRKKSANPNIEGEEAPNVRTNREGTSDVPASRQSAIRPKESKKKDRDPSNK